MDDALQENPWPEIGQSDSVSKTITQDDVEAFARLTGDANPAHTDSEFAKTTRFGRRIAHGMFSLGLVSAALGCRLPGPGTLYLGQTAKFLSPVFPGDTITATVTVIGRHATKPVFTLRTVCQNQEGITVLEGEAVVMLDRPATRA